jgi:carbonic anhydrase
MDARIDPAALLGLEPGDAHIIRNAGGIATEDAIRSIAMSQRLLDTTGILVIQHTGCGIHAVEPELFKDQVASDTGTRPTWVSPVRPTNAETLELTLEILRNSEAIPHRDLIDGTIIDLVGSDSTIPVV